ncbi:alpha/beta hydrolase [Streptomyces dysideae]|uniref:alpha/beta hydrolase n=1 Tax=Streptomyces dysideae TaxID=909626 RepID=UPI000A400369|nr:alpha/beta hydrolase [Streptomyces dysideae]
MRLIFVHGRSQGAKSSEILRDEWLKALTMGCTRAGTPLPNSLDVKAPFYAEFLDKETAAGPPMGIPTYGAAEGPPPFPAEILLELAERAGITDEEITEALEVPALTRGPENWEWVRAAARLLSDRVPLLAEEFIRRFTADVHAYLLLPHVRKGVNDIVSAELGTEPAVVVSHSLGTVVSYCVLTDHQAPPTVPLMVTLGSPLGIQAIKRRLSPPLGKPSCIQEWFNAADRRDPIALYPNLGGDNFPAPIENHPYVENPQDNPHGIVGYLSDPTVAKKVAAALSA